MLRHILFLIKGIIYTIFTWAWVIFIVCLIATVMFVFKTWMPMLDAHHKYDHVESRYGDHGPY